MSKKETVLKTLLPENVLSTTEGLIGSKVEFLRQIDSLLESKYRKNIGQHWIDATILEDYLRGLGELSYSNNPLLYKDRPNAKMSSQLFQFSMPYLLTRFDISLAALLGVHQDLGHNTSYFGGSKERIAKYVPKLQLYELRTCFILTGPEHGSDVAGGLETVAEHRSNTWVINGEKKWINGTHVSSVTPVFTVNKETGKLRCFVIRPKQGNVDIEVIDNKIALRIVPNALIKLTNVKVDEADHLQNIASFKDIAKILYSTRTGVAYMATGGMAGALHAISDYVIKREQFGEPINKYQLMQEKLATMQSNLTQAIATCAQLANIQAYGEYDEVVTSTTKMMSALRLRETVAMGRGITGNNGVLADDYDITRFFSGVGAIYTYESTYEINALVIGHVLTGDSAFV